MELYPLLFYPIYKKMLWGGQKISALTGCDAPGGTVGERWDICDREDGQSVVQNGSLQGQTLGELVEAYPRQILGTKEYKGQFPILVKLVDANKDLSLQVHPGKYLSACLGDEEKNEMWYVINHEENACICDGLMENTTRQEFMRSIVDDSLDKHLRMYNSKQGDCYYIPSGTVHSIGAGNFVLEVQQNSNTTYRISDWGRVDEMGKERQLHLAKALDAIDFGAMEDKLVKKEFIANTWGKQAVLVDCPWFKVSEVENQSEEIFDISRCTIISALNSPVMVSCAESFLKVEPGCSCLLPAACSEVGINGKGKAFLMTEVKIP